MDLWGTGCVLYEMITRLALFPGSNELDQLDRIHNVLGTPSPKLLKKMLGTRHVEYNFPNKSGSGLVCLLPQVTRDCISMLDQLLIYDPDLRLMHAYIVLLLSRLSTMFSSRNTIHRNSSNNSKNPGNLKQN